MDITFKSETLVSAGELNLLIGWGIRACVTDCTVTRRSDRTFDLDVNGHTDKYPSVPGLAFSAWLPLACINDLTSWASPKVYDMCDHPYMEGDWSGIRDSEPETIWAIFERHVVHMVTR